MQEVPGTSPGDAYRGSGVDVETEGESWTMPDGGFRPEFERMMPEVDDVSSVSSPFPIVL